MISSPQHSQSVRAHNNQVVVRPNIWLILGISTLVVLPCFWQRKIEAGDLPSHTYNAWLAQLIAHGQAPGLYLAKQWNNVLVDLMLAKLGALVGLAAAEKMVVSSCVLVFFWGAFRLMTTAAGRPPWLLSPAIAMVSYGWTFQMGFLNYYLSLGLAFLAVAYFWQGGRAQWLTGSLLAVAALIAHPIGFLWLIGTALYVILAGRLSPFRRWALFPAALVGLFGLHFYISHRYRTSGAVGLRFYRFIGPDQLVIYGQRYRLLAAGFLLLVAAIALDGLLRERANLDLVRKARTSVELWTLSVVGVALLWEGITIPNYATGLTFLTGRLTSIVAVLLLCTLATVQPKKWHLAALLGCAALFFGWMWQDTRTLNRMEEEAVNLVSGLPPGTKVIQTIWPLPGYRVDGEHIVDRACIGRCFAFANYEPSSGQFRIRVEPNSPVAVASAVDGLAMREGKYVVRPTDPPMVQIYQCDERDLTKLCLRQLVAGEVNGRLGYRPTY
jgi:hypothetical protein